WKTWSQLKAVKAGRLLAVPDKGLERASGQMVGAVAKVCSVIAPDR
ncbi:MAG: cobalamin-binding protein, partial [Pseudomonas graminis]